MRWTPISACSFAFFFGELFRRVYEATATIREAFIALVFPTLSMLSIHGDTREHR
jgi:hypothetical protein